MLKRTALLGLVVALLCTAGYQVGYCQGETPPTPETVVAPQGEEKIAAAITAGLGWLANHQGEDGGWNPAEFVASCSKEKCGGPGEIENKIGASALALVAFLRAGVVPDAQGDEHAQSAARAVRFLVGRQDSHGAFSPTNVAKHMYGQACATLALSMAAAATKDDELNAAVEKAVKYLVQAQNPGAGWRYSPRCGETDTSVTGWCILALDAARQAGFSIPEQAFKDASAWVESVTIPESFLVGYMSRSDAVAKIVHTGKNDDYANHPTMTALGFLIHAAAGRPFAEKGKAGFMSHLAGDLPRWDDNREKEPSMDFVYWHIGTKTVLSACDCTAPLYSAWRKAITNALLGKQKDKGCAAGSWDPVCRWSFAGGRPWATAMNVATLCELKSETSSLPVQAKPGISSVLTSTLVTLNFVDASLSDVIEFLRSVHELNVVQDPEVDKSGKIHVTFKVMELRLDNALTLLLRSVGLEYGVFDDIVFISTPEGILKKKEEALLRQLSDLKISADFDQVPLQEVLDFVQDFISVPIVMDGSVPEATKKKLVTIRMKDTSTEEFLGLLMETSGCKYDVLDGPSIVVSLASPATGHARIYRRTYSLNSIDKPVEAVLDLLEKVLGRPAVNYHQETNSIIVEGNVEEHQAVIETLGMLRSDEK